MENFSALLQDRTVIVTGAARGIGEAIARSLISCGANVALVDWSTSVESLAQQHSDRAIAIVGDVADAHTAERTLAAALDRFGSVTGLVNNASVIQEGPFWEEIPQSLRLIVEANVLGAMQFGAVVGRHFAAAGGGRIVNLTSGAAAGYKLFASYGATKAAMTGLTYGWALDGFEFGIDVNAIAPVARTYMATFSDRQRRLMENPPPPESIAPLAAYLMGPHAAGITGQVFRITEKEISLVSPPRATLPTITSEGWNHDTLADAVDQLRSHVETVGNRGWQPPTQHFDLVARNALTPSA